MIGTPVFSYYQLYFLLPVAYIIGSIPFGVLVSRRKGIDLTTTGSRNIGATNVLRTAGVYPAIFTLVGDVLKGSIAVLLCRLITHHLVDANSPNTLLTVQEIWEGITGITVVLGHILSVFMSFRGGKGVATGFGVLIVYSPQQAAIALIIWICTAVLLRYSSLAAIFSMGSLPLIFSIYESSDVKMYFGAALGILILLRHRNNIKRLIRGMEPKLGDKSRL